MLFIVLLHEGNDVGVAHHNPVFVLLLGFDVDEDVMFVMFLCSQKAGIGEGREVLNACCEPVLDLEDQLVFPSISEGSIL